MEELNASVKAIQAQIDEMNALLEPWRNARGALKTLHAISLVMSWFTIIGAAIGGAWLMIKGAPPEH